MASRPRSWADVRINLPTIVAAAPEKINLLGNAPISDTLTVIRIIGDFWVFYEPTAGQVDSLSSVDVGIGVTSIEGFTVAGTALPNPSIDTQFPPRGWLYAATQPVVQFVRPSADAGFQQINAHFKFDLRAMRKIDKGVLFMTIENNNIVVGGSMRAVGRVRSLCLA